MRNNNERYPEGYKPKIEFWEAKYYMALEEGIRCYARGDKKNGEKYHLMAKGAMEKIMYFKGREEMRAEVSIW